MFIHRNGSNPTDMHVCRTLSFWNVLCCSSDHFFLVCVCVSVHRLNCLSATMVRSIQSVFMATQTQNTNVRTLSTLLLWFWSHLYYIYVFAISILRMPMICWSCCCLFVCFLLSVWRVGSGHIHSQFNHIDSIEVFKWECFLWNFSTGDKIIRSKLHQPNDLVGGMQIFCSKWIADCKSCRLC